MTQEDKNLLLKDLCARLPYGVIMRTCNNMTEKLCSYMNIQDLIDLSWKPYLRPISSMTEEEREEYQAFFNYDGVEYPEEYIDWLTSHHFDYRGLIEKGLALEAPEDMYKNN